jgi:putative intracellular protease/amidase
MALVHDRQVTAVICHATCVLLKTRLANGRLLVEGRTWTGFANSEERDADGRFKPHVVPTAISSPASSSTPAHSRPGP